MIKKKDWLYKIIKILKKYFMMILNKLCIKDILYKIIKILEKYFMKILNKLWIEDILLRRKIELKEYIIILHHINDQEWIRKYVI